MHLSLGAAALAALAGSASAETFGETGLAADTLVDAYIDSLVTPGSPTWQRPSSTFGAGSGSLERFHDRTLVLGAGRYNFLSLGTSPANWDNFLHLYNASFSSAAPTTNGIVGNDDFPSIGRSGFNGVNLAAGTYHLVTSEFSSSTTTRTFSNTVSLSGPGNVPDNNANGVVRTINVPDPDPHPNVPNPISGFNSITLRGLTHTWVGDLVVTLSHGGVTVDLMDRLGATTAGAFGNSENLSGDYTFMLGAPAQPAAAAMPAGTYAPNANGTAGQSSLATGLLSDFTGLEVSGAWTLNVTDRAGGDLGVFNGWDFNVKFIPTPGASALLGLAGLAGLRRRRA